VEFKNPPGGGCGRFIHIVESWNVFRTFREVPPLMKGGPHIFNIYEPTFIRVSPRGGGGMIVDVDYCGESEM
jgi:hypothetical protein